MITTFVELSELADHALEIHGEYGPQRRAQIFFAAYVGLLPAELFVLERDDVDQEREEIRISRSLGSGGEVTLPKNGKPRTVVLPPPAREAMVSFPRRVDVPWLFTSKTGTRLSKISHYYLWNRVRDVAGRPGMDFYELRHFFATYLLEQGLSPADVAIQLGHTDGGALVMSTYGHPSEVAARQRIKKAFRPKVRKLRVAEQQRRASGE
jgi:integrase